MKSKKFKVKKLFPLKRKLISNRQILFLLAIYFSFSFSTFALWEHKGINQVTGDEPHYLVMTNGIVKYKTFEQTKPYKEEFTTREIYAPGLAQKNENPSPSNTHALLGKNGLFNVHNLGLPLILSIPFALGGVIGAKVFMIIIGGLIMLNFWDFAKQHCQDNNIIFTLLLPIAISQPILFASNQIYPELLVALFTIGLINIFSKYKYSDNLNTKDSTICFLVISFLPWLQLKFAVVSLLLYGFLSWRFFYVRKDLKQFRRMTLFCMTSGAILIFYNYFAFNSFLGPHQQWSLLRTNNSPIQLSWKSITVFLSLIFDQEQGFLMQNPLNLIGLVGIGCFYKINRSLAILTGLIFTSILFINSLHTQWYGGYSMVGRFGWTSGLIFVLFTIYGLITIYKINKNLILAINSFSIIVSIYLFDLISLKGTNIYNLNAYVNSGRLYHSISEYLPFWMNERTSLMHIPNIFFLIMSIYLIILGFKISRSRSLKENQNYF